MSARNSMPDCYDEDVTRNPFEDAARGRDEEEIIPSERPSVVTCQQVEEMIEELRLEVAQWQQEQAATFSRDLRIHLMECNLRLESLLDTTARMSARGTLDAHALQEFLSQARYYYDEAHKLYKPVAYTDLAADVPF